MRKTITIETSKEKEVIDCTGKINKLLKGKEGLCHLFLLHTTAALTTADLDPGTDLDILETYEKMIPKLNFRHAHNPSHTWTHIMSSIVGTSLAIPFKEGKLILGTWQRVVLIELDGPKTRQIVIDF